MSVTLQELLAAVRAKPSGDGWQGHCPAHEDSTASLSISEREGKILLHCHAHCTQKAVLEVLRERGLWPVHNGQQSPTDRRKATRSAARIPIPEEAKHSLNVKLRDNWTRRNRGEVTQGWRYHTAEGGWAFCVVRFESGEDRKKTIRPYYYGADSRWHEGQLYKSRRPLYRLPELLAQPERLVLVVEGEKAADAARGVLGEDMVVTTWAGGCKAVAKTAFNPLVDRVVTIMPDRDEPGRKAAAEIARRLPQARIIDPGPGEDGWDAADAVAEGWDRERFLALIASASLPEEAPEPDLPEIVLRAGEMPRIMKEALDVLVGDPTLYQYGEERTTIVRVAGQRVERVGIPWLLGALERQVQFMKWDGRSERNVRKDAPERLAKLILDSRGEWPFRHVRAVIPGPTLRLDGEIIDQPGYDSVTGLLYAPTGPAASVPRQPSLDDVREALKTLLAPFRKFPYASAADWTNALAMKLTAAVRAVLSTAPAALLNAPEVGTGKTMEARATAAIACGFIPSVHAWPYSEEELRKALLSIYMEAPAAVVFDNVMGDLSSAHIARLLTTSKVADRILGQTQTVDVPTRALLLFSGNNVSLLGDLPRRFLTIRLDAKTETPWLREFDFDALEVTERDWLRLRIAALTVLRGFFVAGAPKKGPGQLGSFEQWDRMIRQCLVWLRDSELADHPVVDPIESLREAKSENPDTLQLQAILEAWYGVFGSEPKTVQEAIRVATEKNEQGEEEEQGEKPAARRKHQALYQALYEIAGEKGYINPKSLGKWLSYRRGRHFKDRFFESSKASRGGALKWEVRHDDDIPF